MKQNKNKELIERFKPTKLTQLAKEKLSHLHKNTADVVPAPEKKAPNSELIVLDEIKKAIAQGERTILVRGKLTRKQIAFLKKETGAEIKDVTLFFQSPSHLKRREYRECANFISRVEEAALSLSPFKTVSCFKEDGSIGVKLIEYPIFIVICNFRGE